MQYPAFHREMKHKITLAEYHRQMSLKNHLHSGSHNVLLKQLNMNGQKWLLCLYKTLALLT